MANIKVGIVGYGTIGKRVTDAVLQQDDMDLIGITGHSYNYKMIVAAKRGIPIYNLNGTKEFEEKNMKLAGDFQDLLGQVDVIVDASPKTIPAQHKKEFYVPKKIKGIFNGGEKPEVADVSFTAQCNYDDAVNKNYVRVVSCNTTGLARTLHALDEKYGLEAVHASLVRRAADPWDIRHGPINALVPVLELPSHHGPDVNTVLKGFPVFTTALAASTTLMHMHTVIADCKSMPDVDEVIEEFHKTTRVLVVDNASGVRSTAEVMEFAKDLNRNRGDMPETIIWKEGVGVENSKIFYMQAIHQESDVVPENIDAIRAVMGFEDGKKSIEKTNKAMGIDKYKRAFAD